MPIEIIIPRFKTERHLHLCPMCHKPRLEENILCKKNSGDHKFVCVVCVQDYRRRFGSISDSILDEYLGPQEMELAKHVAPDAVSDDLDRRDDEKRRTENHRVAERDLSQSETQSRIALSAAEQKKEYARAIEQAETITWEDAQSEIEAMKKKEEW
jgi:hypothetical protein